MEVWAVGDLPVKEGDEEGNGHVGFIKHFFKIIYYITCNPQKRSVLDSNLEDRAMLEISGKKMHSDGLREPSMDD